MRKCGWPIPGRSWGYARRGGSYATIVDPGRLCNRGANFSDEIGRYCYPVDIHPSSPDKGKYEKFEKDLSVNYHYKTGESYGIPYRSLIPKDLDNALVAGRCIGSDRYIQGSIRVMPGLLSHRTGPPAEP